MQKKTQKISTLINAVYRKYTKNECINYCIFHRKNACCSLIIVIDIYSKINAEKSI